MKDKLCIQENKLEVLTNYWDKMVYKLQKKASMFKKGGDTYGDRLVLEIVMIPKQVRRAALNRFLKQCRLLHHIAFF